MKAIKADDSQWVAWIKQKDVNLEKKWANIFSCMAILALIAGGVSFFISKQMLSIPFVMGAGSFYLMSIAKYNNFRLYRIIQNLSEQD